MKMKTHPDLNEIPFLCAKATDAELQALINKYPGRIQFVEEDSYTLRIGEHVPAPRLSEQRSYPWGIIDINADQVRGRGGGVNVDVVDTGIRTSHTEFGGRAFAGVD